MILFIRKKKSVKKDPQWGHSYPDGWIERMAKRVMGWQRRLSLRLQKASEALSAAGKKTALALLCVIGAGCSLWIAAGAIFSNSEVRPIKWIPIKTVLLKAGDFSFSYPDITQDPLLRRIEDFKKYMDSLGGTVSGRSKRDSLLATRPGLMDSITHLEKIYRTN